MARGPAKSNLPVDRSAFVGRAAERAAIGALFDQGARLVSVLGPGGIGKTRTALRYAAEQAAAFAAHGGGGTWLCDLTDVREPVAACGVVGERMRLAPCRSTDPAAVVEHVGRALARRRRVLLVLDNCDDLAPHADRVIGAWLRAAPELRVLLTSRSPMAIEGEFQQRLDGLGEEEGAELLLHRARQVRPDLVATDEVRATARDIVRSVDGMPLAIELAAARLSVLSLGQLRSRLAAPLQVLVSPTRGARHGSLRAVIASTYQTLGGAAQACFAACAVFRGSFSLEAAEGIGDLCGATAMEGLEALAARSLVQSRPQARVEGSLRFSMYAAIRDYALERLAERGDESETRDRHARGFAAAARALLERIERGEGAAALLDLAEDADNLVDAHARAVHEATRLGETSWVTDALDLALAVDGVVAPRGAFALRLRVLDESVRAAQALDPSVETKRVALARIARARIHWELGALDLATSDLDAALESVRGEPALEALALARRAQIMESTGATGVAKDLLDRALSVLASESPGAPKQRCEAEIHTRLGHVLRREGEVVGAAESIERAVTLRRALGDDDGLAMALYEAAVLQMFRGRLDEALDLVDDGLRLAERSGLKGATAALTTARGTVLQERGDARAAVELHARAVLLFRELGQRAWEASTLYYLAGAYLETGDRREASKLLVEALALACEVGEPRYAALIEACMGAVHAMDGDDDAAVRALGRAAAQARACRSERSLDAALTIHAAHVGYDALDGEGRRVRVDRARSLVSAHANDDPRFALRVLEGREHRSARQADDGHALIVLDGGAGFQVPGGAAPVDLSRRAPLRRILLALAQKRLAQPGEPLTLDEILEAGWPGERVSSASAANRVYVALATLRKLGLRPYLLSVEGGYLLSLAVSTHLRRAGSPMT